MTGGEDRSRRWRSAAMIGLAGLMSVAILLLAAATALAASPTPAVGGDPRSSGQGPGLVGDPAFAVLLVVGIGVGTLVATLAYIRFTGGRKT